MNKKNKNKLIVTGIIILSLFGILFIVMKNSQSQPYTIVNDKDNLLIFKQQQLFSLRSDNCEPSSGYEYCYENIYKKYGLKSKTKIEYRLDSLEDYLSLKYNCEGDSFTYFVNNKESEPTCTEFGCDGIKSSLMGELNFNYDELKYIVDNEGKTYLTLVCFDNTENEFNSTWSWSVWNLWIKSEELLKQQNTCTTQNECSQGYRCVVNTASEPQINKDYVAKTNQYYTCQRDLDNNGIIDIVELQPQQPKILNLTEIQMFSKINETLNMDTDQIQTKNILFEKINNWFNNVINKIKNILVYK